jgi:hypothetical protein
MVQAKAPAMSNPQAQQGCIEDNADASLRAQHSENAGLGKKMPFMGGHWKASIIHG